MSNETRNMLLESLEKVFQDRCTADRVQELDLGGFDPKLWSVVEELGFNSAGLSEDKGGAGASTLDLVALLRLAGSFCAPVPLAETMFVGTWLLSGAGLEVPAGPLAIAPSVPAEEAQISRSGKGWTVSGTLHRVAWPDQASRILLLLQSMGQNFVAAVDPEKCQLEPVLNLAGETRSTIVLDAIFLNETEVAAAPTGVNPATLAERNALGRAALITGALDKALELALAYAAERKQFGRPLAAFQAIQHQLADFAAEVAAAKSMTDQAAILMERGPAGDAVAAAKIRAGQAAGTGARIAHQVHGAIGFTQEYPLQHATRRLWAWRDENGSERYWANKLGRAVAARGADNLWSLVTGTL